MINFCFPMSFLYVIQVSAFISFFDSSLYQALIHRYEKMTWKDFQKSIKIFDPTIGSNDGLFDDFLQLRRTYAKLSVFEDFLSLSLSQKWCQILKNQNFKILPDLVEKACKT